MSYADRHIVETYSGLFSGLSSLSKLELIENLTKSIRKEKRNKDRNFFKSFGSFASLKTAEDIITEIKESRKFKSKEIDF